MSRHRAQTPPDLHPLAPYPDWAPSHSDPDPDPGPTVRAMHLAPLLGVATATLLRWRAQGYGPPHHAVGSDRGYSLPEVIQWLASQKDYATPAPPPGELADLGLTRAQLTALVESATALSLGIEVTRSAVIGHEDQLSAVVHALRQVASDA